MYEFVHRIAPGIMVPEHMADFNVSAQTLGSLSAYYYYAYAIAQIPVGILLDRYSTKYLLTFAAALIAVGSYIFSKTSDIHIANCCRIIIGLGSAFSFVGCLKLAVNWFSKQRFGILVGLTNLLGVMGAILGGRPLAHFMEHYNWRTSMEISAMVGAIFIVLLFIIVKDAPSKNNKKTAKIKIDLKNNLNILVQNKQIWLIAMFGSLMVVPIASYAELWGVTYLIEQYKISRPMAGQIVSFTFIGIAFGGPINGYISDLISRRKPVMLVGSIGAVLSFSTIIYSINLSIIYLQIMHILFGFFCSSMLLCFSLNTEKVKTNVRSTVIGFTNTLIMGISAMFQPLIGSSIDLLKTKNIEIASDITFMFQISFIPLIACLIIAAILLTWISESH